MKTLWCSVAKSSRSRNVFPFVERRNPDLHGHLYLPLDRRQQGDEPVLCRIYRGKYWIVDEYEMNDLPCSDYERMHMT
jgi:hypothetical protein